MKNVYWITKTAVFIALLVALQAVTKPAGQWVTGSTVNLVLILAGILGGPASGVCVGLISPVMAALLGIAPNWGLVPFIIAGNLSIVIVWCLLSKLIQKPPMGGYAAALVAGAFVKFGVLYFGVVKIGIPFILKLPEKQAAAIGAQFGITQLFTAAIGGAVACIILPLLVKTVRRMETRAGIRKNT